MWRPSDTSPEPGQSAGWQEVALGKALKEITVVEPQDVQVIRRLLTNLGLAGDSACRKSKPAA